MNLTKPTERPLIPSPVLPAAFSWTAVAEALTVLLDRRYLDALDSSLFHLVQDAEDGVPLLCKVTSVGHVGGHESPRSAVPQLLAASHLPGHDFVAALHGDGRQHHLYYGQRRRAGRGSAESAMAGLRGAFRAELPGVSLADAQSLAPTGCSELEKFLASAPALATLTGVPSPAGLRAKRSQLERLVSAMGGKRYALMIVAEALPPRVVDEAMCVCRRIVSELHPAIASMVSEGKTATNTHSVMRNTTVGGNLSMLRHIAPALAQAVGFALGVGGLTSALGAAGQWVHPLGVSTVATTLTDMQALATTDSTLSNLLDAEVRHCSMIVETHHDRLNVARGGGWWRSALYLCAEDEAALHCAAQALRGASAGEGTATLEPMRLQRPPAHIVRSAMQMGRLIQLRARDGGVGHPLGPIHEAIATCVSCEELAVMVAPPREEAPGLPIAKGASFASSAPTPEGISMRIGDIEGGDGESSCAVALSARALNEHVLVVGTPGSGKTNTCMAILLQAHRHLRVPFLVIEPAKTEYRRLVGDASLRERLRVYSVGGVTGLPLRLNPLRPVPGASLLGHIDLLKAVFNASFSMGPGMPQVLEQALVEVYEQRGWNLFTGTNEALEGKREQTDLAEALLPTLGDLQQQVDAVLDARNYSEAVRRDLGAALTSRINGLRMGAKGLVLDTRRSTPLSDLFEGPVVLELNALRDDEEKSFVMAVVLALLNQHCEVRQRQFPNARRESLQHITLVEEAHRLLSAAPPRSAESADPRGKGVAIFTDMLAELRALGEGFIVAEQIPTKLAPDVLKNTNLKIIHRMTAPADCAALGESVNLSPHQIRALVSLPSGHAVVHGLAAGFYDPIADAALVRIDSVKDDLRAGADVPMTGPAASSRSLWQMSGCESCDSPCMYYPRVTQILRISKGGGEFTALVEPLLGGNPQKALDAFSAWKAAVSQGQALSSGDLHCLFVHASHRWLSKVLAARRADWPASGPLSPVDILAADRVTSDFGRLAASMLAEQPDGLTLANVLQEVLVRLITAGKVTGGLAACAACPAPCKGLPHVVLHAGTEAIRSLASHFPSAPKDAFGRAPDIDARRAQVVDALDRVLAGISVWSSPLVLDAIRYCHVAHLKVRPEQEVSKAAVLSLMGSLVTGKVDGV